MVVQATLYRTGYLEVSTINCKEIPSECIAGIATGFFRLPSGIFIMRKAANAFFSERGFDVNSCYCCKHQQPSGNCCELHMSHKTPLHPSSEEANYCSYYSPRTTEKTIMIPGYLYEKDPASRNKYPFFPYREDSLKEE